MVEIESCAVPLPAIVEGVKVQLAPAGSPVQELEVKVMFPLKPSHAVTVSATEPDAPGAETARGSRQAESGTATIAGSHGAGQ